MRTRRRGHYRGINCTVFCQRFVVVENFRIKWLSKRRRRIFVDISGGDESAAVARVKRLRVGLSDATRPDIRQI